MYVNVLANTVNSATSQQLYQKILKHHLTAQTTVYSPTRRAATHFPSGTLVPLRQWLVLSFHVIAKPAGRLIFT